MFLPFINLRIDEKPKCWFTIVSLIDLFKYFVIWPAWGSWTGCGFTRPCWSSRDVNSLTWDSRKFIFYKFESQASWDSAVRLSETDRCAFVLASSEQWTRLITQPLFTTVVPMTFINQSIDKKIMKFWMFKFSMFQHFRWQ